MRGFEREPYGGIGPIGANLRKFFPKDTCSIETIERGNVL
jgi:hypothetical protein